MSRPIRPICTKCQREYKVKKQGIVTELMGMFGGKLASHELYSSDLWECPMCGHQIVGGFGEEALARHFEEKYEEILEEAGKTYKCY